MSRTLLPLLGVLVLAACDSGKVNTDDTGGTGDGGSADGGSGDGGSGDGGTSDGGSGDGGAMDGGGEDGGAMDGGGEDGGATDNCPNIAVSTTDLGLYVSVLGDTVVETVVVTNDCTGDSSLEVDAVVSGDSAFSGAAEASLAPGEAITVEVSFTPPELGEYTGSLDITSNDPDDPTLEVALTGVLAADADGDGYDAIEAGGTDCDDGDAAIHPKEAEDARDLVDDDCDGTVDEDFIDVGSVWVTEIMMNPVAVGDGYGEWFELYNGSGGSIDLVGWRISADDGDEMTIADSVVIEDGAYATLAVTDDTTLNGGVTPDVVYNRDDFSLADSADSIFLYLAGTPIFDLSYTSDWPLGDGASMILDPYYGAGDSLSSSDLWCTSTSDLSGGDQGTPGAENDSCTSVDRDEDGYTEDEGDCDDWDADLNPDMGEPWDGIDNNCDGLIDKASPSDANLAIDGNDGDYLSAQDSLSVADVTGDGIPDLLVGGSYASTSYSGAVGVLDGADWEDWDGSWSDLALSTITGDNSYNYLALLGPEMGDQDGDGTADIFVGGSDYYSSSSYGYAPAAVLIWGGDLEDEYTDGNYDVYFTGGDLSSYSGARVASHADYDGDGRDDLVYADYTATADREYYRGLVALMMAADIEDGGNYDFEDDSELLIWGDDGYDELGNSLGGGDIDGDGYDELMIGAPGYYYNTEGKLYIIEGNSSLGGTGTVGLLASTRIDGVGDDDRVGYRTSAQLGDFDGDDAMDLVVTASEIGETYVFYDAASLSGEVSASEADLTISGGDAGFFGYATTVGDFDGDGQDDLVVGAPDYDAYYYLYYYADDPGAAALFAGADMTDGEMDIEDASWWVEASGNNGLGYSLANGDFDDDGTPELLTGMPGYSSDYGRVLLFDL